MFVIWRLSARVSSGYSSIHHNKFMSNLPCISVLLPLKFWKLRLGSQFVSQSTSSQNCLSSMEKINVWKKELVSKSIHHNKFVCNLSPLHLCSPSSQTFQFFRLGSQFVSQSTSSQNCLSSMETSNVWNMQLVSKSIRYCPP